MVRVQLINPLTKTDSKYFVVEPSLGLLSIGSYIRSKDSSIEVEILDGQIVSREYIEERIGENAAVVGISANVMNYSPELATIAKNRGAMVVFGGCYPSRHYTPIINNQPSVDAVVVGEGEEPFLKIVNGWPLDKIAGVFYKGATNRTNTYSANITELPMMDWNLVDLRAYHERSDLKTGSLQAPIYISKGCRWRAGSKGCKICSIFDKEYKIKNPKRFWDEVKTMYNLGIRHIRDESDDIPPLDWLKTALVMRPHGLEDLTFYGYASTRNLNEETLDLLSKLGYVRFFTGLESGDDTILKNIHKGTTRAKNLETVKRMTNKGISIVGSWILGNEGETDKSLQNTLDHATEIAAIGNVDVYLTNLIVPLPGSDVFRKLNKSQGNKYDHQDELSIPSMHKEWIENFCDVDIDTIKSYQKKIMELSPIKAKMS